MPKNDGTPDMVPMRLAATAALCMTMVLALPLPSPAGPAELELGRKVFLELSEPRCALCHTLADAGTTGNVGPNLDDLQPDYERIKAAITDGVGLMPANEALNEDQMHAVAIYVSTVAGKAD